MERTKETLEARVRETPLVDRLKECQKRIGNMCAELRGPKMSIPVEYYDDDFYICTTLADAQATVEALQARVKELQGIADEKCRCFLERAEQSEKQLTQRTAELEALQRERDEAIEAASLPTWVCDGCGRVSSEGWINRVTESLDGTDYEMECPVCGVRAIEEDCASDLVRERDDLQAALDAEREKVKGLAQQVQDQSTANLETMRHTDDMQSRALDAERALAHLQALVRALPVVRIDLNDAYHDTLLAQPEDEAVKELLRYRASLDATTPDSNQLGDINDMVSKGGDGE